VLFCSGVPTIGRVSRKIFAALLDIKKVYASVPHAKTVERLRDAGVKEETVRTVTDLLPRRTTTVCGSTVSSALAEEFHNETHCHPCSQPQRCKNLRVVLLPRSRTAEQHCREASPSRTYSAPVVSCCLLSETAEELNTHGVTSVPSLGRPERLCTFGREVQSRGTRWYRVVVRNSQFPHPRA